MEQKLKHLRLPLAILAVAVMSACGKTPDQAAAMPPAKISVAKVLEQLKGSAPEQVLIFTDLIGATPSNIGVRVAQSLNAAQIKTELLTGTNICMLLSAVRYRDMPIEQLQDKVIEAGKRGMQSIDCDGGEGCL